MNISIKNALYIAGTILLGSVIIAQFEQKDLITSTILVILSMVLLVWGYQKDKKSLRCAITSKKPWKITLMTLGAIFVFGALGFTIGKLIYLWSNL